jgi:hypothetical protein
MMAQSKSKSFSHEQHGDVPKCFVNVYQRVIWVKTQWIIEAFPKNKPE